MKLLFIFKVYLPQILICRRYNLEPETCHQHPWHKPVQELVVVVLRKPLFYQTKSTLVAQYIEPIQSRVDYLRIPSKSQPKMYHQNPT
jgi:hypothetical protein